MSYTVKLGEIEVVCDTLDELQDFVDRYGVVKTPASKKTAAAPAAATAAPKKDRTGEKGLSEKAYVKHSWRVVRMLLKAEHRNVGKLKLALADELGIQRTMFARILDRLLKEQPSFLIVQGSYVRLSHPEAAVEFADFQEALFKEQLAAETKV